METVLYEYEATHHKIMIFWMQSAQDHFLWIVMLVTATTRNYHKLSKYSTILLLALASSTS
jgi:hypothetical protein